MITKHTNFLIVGLGLIGGSYAIGLSKEGYKVHAIDIKQEAIDYALHNHSIVSGTIASHQQEVIHLIQQADCIIFGLYPSMILPWIKQYQSYIKANTLLTDVSGVKCNIVEPIQEYLRNDIEFIGSHPMAGKEVSGNIHSDNKIFQEANFIITPTHSNTQKAIDFMKDFADILHFQHTSLLSLSEHDRMIGFLSQLTHVIAISLMNTNDNPQLVEYTGDSFRDLTRIAKINETLWSELFFLNKDILLEEINAFSHSLEIIKQKLETNDEEGLKELMITSTKRRKLFDQKKRS